VGAQQEGGGRLGGRKGGGEQHEAKAGALLHRRRWCSRRHLVVASLGRLFRPLVRRPAALCRLSRRLSAGAWIWRVVVAEGASLEMFVRDGLWHTWPRLASQL